MGEKKWMQRGSCLVLTLAMLSVLVLPAWATGSRVTESMPEQTQTTAEEEIASVSSDERIYDDRQDALASIMEQNPADAPMPETERPELPEADCCKQFTYNQDIMLSGIFETQSMFFRIPDYWECKYAYAQIEFSISQMIQGDVPASLTFLVNDTPVRSCALSYSLGRSQIVYIEIPVELLREGYNTFEITGYVRLYDDEGCIDDFSGANWIHISKSSFVEVGYDLLPHENRISYYPYPFMSSADPRGAKTQVVVSDAMENCELAAALLIRADLAGETDSEDDITLTSAGNMRTEGVQTVLVGLTKNLPEEFKSFLTDEELDNPRLSAAALVKFVEYQGEPVLLITSQSGECLMEAGMMLADETRVTQEETDTAWVMANASQLIREAKGQSHLAAGRYTIEGIVGSGLNYVGPFHQEYVVYLPFSGGYVLANSSKINLRFRYSENLDFDRSMITVCWGNVPIASKKLTRELAGGDELSFTMPEDVIGTAASSLAITFDLELPELFCTPRLDEMPWAYVQGDSTLYLPVGVSGTLSFDLRPYPFEESSMFNDLMVVIPENPTDTELNTIGRVVALYGENITSYGTIDVCRGSELDPESADYNMIVVGTYQNNPLIRSLNERLAFPYNEDGTVFQGNEKQILSEGYAKRIAVMQLLPSEFADNRGILVVSGLNDATLEQVNSFLKVDKHVWTLSGDTVVIDGSEELRAYQFLETESIHNTPDLKTYLEENRESVIFTVTATSAMLLLFLGCLLILLRIYSRSKENRK